MRGQRAGNDTAPIVADPDRWLAAKVVMEFHHVRHDLLVGVGVVGCGDGRAALAPQIGSDAVPAVGGERIQLGAPNQTELRPEVLPNGSSTKRGRIGGRGLNPLRA
jgi:hypothetical protein